MCGDGRLVDIRAYMNGRLGGIEAGACGAYSFAFAFGLIGACGAFLSFFTLYECILRTVVPLHSHWYDV